MVGPRRQNFGVEPLGLRQPALLVELQSLRQRLRDVRWGLCSGCGISDPKVER